MKRLSGWDAMLLYIETPNVHMHTIKAGILDVSGVDGAPTIEAFREILQHRLHMLDPLRFELVDIPLKFHHPMWREHAEVDLEYHVRPLRLPGPGGRREFDEAIGEIASTPLERGKPLWMMYFVEGLADGNIAIITKIHHALADGIASGNLMARAMDLTDTPDDDRDCYEPDPPPSRSELMSAALRDHLRQVGRIPATLRYTAEGIGRFRGSSRKLSTLTRPFDAPPTFINHTLTPQRRFATATLALADIKETRERLGVTINDVVLAISTGAIRRLLLKYDGQAEGPLLASVPVSIDPDPNRVWGNKFTTIAVAVPTHIADPLQRVHQVHAAAAEREGRAPAAGSRTARAVGGILSARVGDGPVATLGGERKANQDVEFRGVQRGRAAPARHGGGGCRAGNLFRRSADLRQRPEHHRVELRRPAQHLGAHRRRHGRRSARSDRRDDRRFSRTAKGSRAFRSLDQAARRDAVGRRRHPRRRPTLKPDLSGPSS